MYQKLIWIIGIAYVKMNANDKYVTEVISSRKIKFLNSISTYRDYLKGEPCLKFYIKG